MERPTSPLMATPAPPPAITPRPGSLPYAKVAGLEPLPGYRLVAPLGRGGFGEVWRCEAPGGLPKAVKFVAPDPDAGPGGSAALRQESEAFERIRAIRHPFILQLERVEVVGGELVMVMELADCQLQDRFGACAARGLCGIPRDELLGYFADAAEALDVMGAQHGLQHLDVKPANLFLVGGHVKVGDYGLVASLQPAVPADGDAKINRGLTPRYVAPEVLRGKVDPRSDQYSLALVYQELLTGGYPYAGKTAPQLMFQHITGTPDLSGLPEADRGPVARALAKDPADRFPSCLAFVQALMTAGPRAGTVTATPADTAMELVRRNRVDRSVADLVLPPAGPMSSSDTHPAPAAGGTSRVSRPDRVPDLHPPDSATLRALPPLTVPGKPLPPLVTPNRGVTPAPLTQFDTGFPPRGPTPPDEIVELTPATRPVSGPGVKLNPIFSVVPVARLLGHAAESAGLGPDHFTDAVVAAAAGGAAPRTPGEVTLLPDGTWTCRFPTTLLPAVAPLKLTTLMEDGWCDEITQPDPTRVVLRVRASGGGGLWGKLAGKPAGAEVVIRLPGGGARAGGTGAIRGPVPGAAAARQSAFSFAGGPVNREIVGGAGDVEVSGHIYGAPDPGFARKAMDGIPDLIREVRRLLQNIEDRRKTPRVPTNCAVTVYPITADGMVQSPVTGVCRDVSTGGVCCVTQTAVHTRYIFVEFPEVVVTTGLAILTRLTRSALIGYEQVLAGRFRTDL